MQLIKGGTFDNCNVFLDGHRYEECMFNSCTFVYAGIDGFGFENNTITGTLKFSFIGNAANTVNAMKAIYSGFGEIGRQTILRTFDEIAPDLKKTH